ncbi:MAG: hypothetical protein ACRC37_03385, partial [Lentisphaeria bacterium]
MKYNYFFVMLLAILLISCEEKEESRRVVRPVKSMVVSSIMKGEVQSLPGVTKALQEATLSFDVSGKLE